MAIADARLGLTATPPRDSRAATCPSELVGPTVLELTVADRAGRFLARFDVMALFLALSSGERSAYRTSAPSSPGSTRTFGAQPPKRAGRISAGMRPVRVTGGCHGRRSIARRVPRPIARESADPASVTRASAEPVAISGARSLRFVDEPRRDGTACPAVRIVAATALGRRPSPAAATLSERHRDAGRAGNRHFPAEAATETATASRRGPRFRSASTRRTCDSSSRRTLARSLR